MRDFFRASPQNVNRTAKLVNQKVLALFLSFPMKALTPSLFDLVNIVLPQCESGVSL